MPFCPKKIWQRSLYRERHTAKGGEYMIEKANDNFARSLKRTSYRQVAARAMANEIEHVQSKRQEQRRKFN